MRRSCYYHNNSESCEAWKSEYQSVGSLWWVGRNLGYIARCHSQRLPRQRTSEFHWRLVTKKDVRKINHLHGRDAAGWDLKTLLKTLTLIQGPTLFPPFPQLSCSMLDDLTLKVPFLASFLIVVPLFVSGYFSLRGDPTVKSFPSYLSPT
jgi:hypothetical protein